jgi:hypothetical protein
MTFLGPSLNHDEKNNNENNKDFYSAINTNETKKNETPAFNFENILKTV